MQKAKKIKASELLLKLRDAVIKLIEQSREMRKTIEDLSMRVTRLEEQYKKFDKRISNLEMLAETKPGAVMEPTRPREEVVDLELEDLAKEIGIDLTPAKQETTMTTPTKTIEEGIPAPPPPPPIGEVVQKKKIEEKPMKEEIFAAEEVLGVKEAEKEELEKEKDELLKVLKELDELK